FLDVCLSAGQPSCLPSIFSNSRRSSHKLVSSQSDDPWIVFSLTLEPGQVNSGLAGDKHYKAALRLALPKRSTVSPVFNAPDKLEMGIVVSSRLCVSSQRNTPNLLLNLLLSA
ncbi:hypothetical protein P879_03858, partial [Paragonimus westermani]